MGQAADVRHRLKNLIGRTILSELNGTDNISVQFSCILRKPYCGNCLIV